MRLRRFRTNLNLPGSHRPLRIGRGLSVRIAAPGLHFLVAADQIDSVRRRVGPKQVRARSTRRQNARGWGHRLVASSVLFASHFHGYSEHGLTRWLFGLAGPELRLTTAGTARIGGQ